MIYKTAFQRTMTLLCKTMPDAAKVQFCIGMTPWYDVHHCDFIMGEMASQITCITIVYSTVCQRFLKTLVGVSKHRNTVFMLFESRSFSSAILWYLWKHTMVWKCIVMYFMLNKPFLSPVHSGADQRKYQSSASLAFVWGIHRWPVNSLHKWPVTRKMFPLDDVIMTRGLDTIAIESMMFVLLNFVSISVILIFNAPVYHPLSFTRLPLARFGIMIGPAGWYTSRYMK